MKRINSKLLAALVVSLMVCSSFVTFASADEIPASNEAEVVSEEEATEEETTEEEAADTSDIVETSEVEETPEVEEAPEVEEILAAPEAEEVSTTDEVEVPVDAVEEIRADINYGTGVDGFVRRCYGIALNRAPDDAGLADWKNKLYKREACGVSVAFGFVYSPEFQNADFTNEVYVTKMYNMLLGRDPDPNGLQYWIDKLDSGETREEIFAGFANSQEFYNLCATYQIVAGTYIKGIGMQENADINGFVTRLYNLCLSRDGDISGQAMWVSGLASGTITGAEAAHGFIFSNEFKNKAYSNYQYVDTLYEAFLDRTGSTNEIYSWSSEIDRGYKSREKVFDGFANSPEFDAICSRYGIVRGVSEYGKVVSYVSGREHGDVEGFEYLYELEDSIGAKYNVTIYIADEVPASILSQCDMDACYNFDIIKEALEVIDEAFAVYPDGFFSQLTYGKVTEFNVYISGMGDAAAFTNYSNTNSQRYICYDAYSITYYEPTIDHEISHCIEQVIMYNSDLLDEDAWGSMNPDGFEYNDSYSGTTDYSGNEDYFVSEYSCTYPEEDRAELFETAMNYYWYYGGAKVDIPSPIEEKMEYYFEAIREIFDTSNWNSIEPWEEILNN